MRKILTALSFYVWSLSANAGDPSKLPDPKAITSVESGPLYLGSINSGFKASEDYFDANLNLVAPVWSSMGTDGFLGGGVLFLEPYVSWGENGEVATSLGLGYRYLFNDQPVSALRSPREDQAGFWDEGLAIGASLFVDMLDTEADNQFWQLGFGLEVATRYVELRGNYYLPLTDKQLAERRTFTEKQTRSKTTTKPVTQTSAPYDDGQGFLVQDQTTSLVATTTTTTTLIRHVFERYEEGMEGWDAEIAFLVPGLDKWCDVKLIGGYFSMDNAPFGPQKGGTGNVEGWKAGVEIRPVPAVALTGMWYEDERFLGSDWMVGARMEIPFEAGDLGDGKGMWGRISDAFKPRRRHLAERMAEPVHRQNAAVHIANTNKQSSKVSKQSTSSNTQVISQTKHKIVLGPGPSGTNFTYASSGALTINGENGNTQTVNGSLYINRAGQSVFVPDGGGGAVLFAHNIGSANGAVNPNLVGATLKVTDNVFLGGRSLVGSTFNLNSGGTTRFVPLTPVSSASINMGSGLTINAGGGGSTNNLIKSTAGTLTLGGLNTYTGNTTLAGATLTLNNPITSGGNAVETMILTGTAGASRVITLTNDNPTNITIDTGTVAELNNLPGGGGSIIKAGAGTLILNGANTYTGSVTVNAGTLMVDSWNALGSQQNVVIGGVSGTGALVLPQNITQSSPQTLVLQNTVNINGAIVPGGSYPVSNGLITVNGGAVRLSGAAITAPTTSVVTTNNLTLNGGGLVVTGSGTTTLNALNAGNLVVTTSNLTLNGGGLVVSSSGTTTLNALNAGNLVVSGPVNLNSSNISLGSGNLTIGSAFTGNLYVPSNFSSATTLVLQRSLSIGGTTVPTGSYPVTNGTIFVNGGILPLSGTTITVPITP